MTAALGILTIQRHLESTLANFSYLHVSGIHSANPHSFRPQSDHSDSRGWQSLNTFALCALSNYSFKSSLVRCHSVALRPITACVYKADFKYSGGVSQLAQLGRLSMRLTWQWAFCVMCNRF